MGNNTFNARYGKGLKIMNGYKKALKRIAKAKEQNSNELNLYELGLTALPTEIGQLTQLEQLNLDNNALTTLPPEIGQLTKLERLDLSFNQLTALPPEIGNLTKLEWIALDNNNLTALPKELSKLTGCEIFYSNNPLKFDFRISDYPVTVLTSKRTLIGCTVFKNKFLLGKNYDNLIKLATHYVLDVNIKLIKQWQGKLREALNAR